MREICWEEAGESRGLAILWMEILEDVFPMERKGCEHQENIKM